MVIEIRAGRLRVVIEGILEAHSRLRRRILYRSNHVYGLEPHRRRHVLAGLVIQVIHQSVQRDRGEVYIDDLLNAGYAKVHDLSMAGAAAAIRVKDVLNLALGCASAHEGGGYDSVGVGGAGDGYVVAI